MQAHIKLPVLQFLHEAATLEHLSSTALAHTLVTSCELLPISVFVLVTVEQFASEHFRVCILITDQGLFAACVNVELRLSVAQVAGLSCHSRHILTREIYTTDSVVILTQLRRHLKHPLRNDRQATISTSHTG
jgi:hypothetical protein